MTREEIREGLKEVVCTFCEIWKTCYDSATFDCPIIEERLDEIFEYLHSQGVVLKVDRELPEELYVNAEYLIDENYYDSDGGGRKLSGLLSNAGYVAVEPLIEKGGD